MANIKKASAAGTFYPSDKSELLNIINNFKCKETEYSSRAVIVPHAGYIYSGELANCGISHLKPDAKNVFIFAPAHFERIFGCAVCSYDAFETPLGNIDVNKELSGEVSKFCDCQTNNFAFEQEHSLEVQLPLIKKHIPSAKIIPVLYGCENFTNLADTIKHFWDNEDNVFVISSDLSHFYPEKESYKIDTYTAKMIEANETRDFEMEQACGAVGICGLTDFAKNNNFSLIRIGMTNSAKVTGDSSRVVGYGSWFLYEGNKNEYIKKYYSDTVLKICKDSILSGFQLGEITPKDYPCVLEETGASFVTLELAGILRGCIGSVIAHKPLVKDLIKNAHAAAFSDPRFNPLTIDEYNKISISVSLLSKPKRIEFRDEEDLLNKLVPYEDGLIIRDGNYQAVFLPIVWEQLPDKHEFLKGLKLKAGMDENYSSETLEAFKFNAVKINQ